MTHSFAGLNNPAYRHGMADTPIHKIWVDMRQRCENPNRTNYKHYGGRGIKVCPRWHNFEKFYEDMGDRPSPKHSIERLDNNSDYAPWNCKWATVIEQRHNNRRNRWITVDGRKQTIGDWAKETGIDERLIRLRIKRGWPESMACTVGKLQSGSGRRTPAKLKCVCDLKSCTTCRNRRYYRRRHGLDESTVLVCEGMDGR